MLLLILDRPQNTLIPGVDRLVTVFDTTMLFEMFGNLHIGEALLLHLEDELVIGGEVPGYLPRSGQITLSGASQLFPARRLDIRRKAGLSVVESCRCGLPGEILNQCSHKHCDHREKDNDHLVVRSLMRRY